MGLFAFIPTDSHALIYIALNVMALLRDLSGQYFC